MIKFSIITVCLNAGEDLKYTVDNVLQQKYDHFELIVKDGLSTDGSTDSLPDDARLIFTQKKDKSVYDAMNQAIEIATGEFCIFINAGDAFHSTNVLDELADYIKETNGEFVYGRSYTISEDIIRFGPKQMTSYFCFRSTICHQAMVIRTSYLKKRSYDVQMKVSADREWMVYAFKEAKMRFIRTNCIITDYKGGGISAASDARSIVQKEEYIIRQRYFTRYENVKYRIFQLLTMQKMRSLINRNPRLQTIYGQAKHYLFGRK